jgi:enolase
LDGTKNKSVLGSNAILAVSIAFAKSVAAAGNIPLFKLIARLSGNNVQMPIPMLNIVNGGVHADNSLDIQEFMIIPKLETISSCLEAASSVFQNLKSLLKKRGYSTNVGDEGGFAPNFKSAIEVLDAISESILKSLQGEYSIEIKKKELNRVPFFILLS